VAFALFGLSPSFVLCLSLLTFVGAVDTIWAAARSTILQWVAPDRLRGRVMGIFQLSNQGLNPLGQVETGLVVPFVGARATTVLGGLIVSSMTLLTAWRVSEIPKFRLDAPNPPQDHAGIVASETPATPFLRASPSGNELKKEPSS
jgi:sugar phosphate permease